MISSIHKDVFDYIVVKYLHYYTDLHNLKILNIEIKNDLNSRITKNNYRKIHTVNDGRQLEQLERYELMIDYKVIKDITNFMNEAPKEIVYYQTGNSTKYYSFRNGFFYGYRYVSADYEFGIRIEYNKNGKCKFKSISYRCEE